MSEAVVQGPWAARWARLRSWLWLPAIGWIVLACLALLQARAGHHIDLTIYGVVLKPAPSEAMLLHGVAFCLLLSPLALLLRDRARQVVLLVASLALGCYLAGWQPLLFLVLAGILLFPLPFLPLARRWRILLLLLLFGGLLGGLAYQRWAGGKIAWYTYYFCMITGFRYILFYYEVLGRRHGWKGTALDYLLYMFCGPFFVVIPYQIVIPSFSNFCHAGKKKTWQQLIMRSAEMLFWALLNLAILMLLVKYARFFNRIPHLGDAYRFTKVLVGVSSASHFLIAILCLWGYNVPDPFRFIFLSRSLAEYLNRFAPHFKDFLATVFYYPMLMKLRRVYPPVSIAVSLIFTIIIGNTVIHFLRYAYFLHESRIVDRMQDIYLENVLLTGALLLWLLVEQLGRRLARRLTLLRSRPVLFLARCVSFSVIYLIFSYVWYV